MALKFIAPAMGLTLVVSTAFAAPSKTGGAPSPSSWSVLRDRGNKLAAEKKFADAEKAFADALKEAESFGERDPRLAESLDNLAGLMKSQKRFADSEKLYQRSFDVRKRNLVAGDPLVAFSLANLIGVYSAEGKHAEAAKLYQSEKSVSQFVEAIKCEYCEARESLVPVYYGKPTEGVKQLAKEGKVKIAGDKKPAHGAQWFCVTCDALLDAQGRAHKGQDSGVKN